MTAMEGSNLLLIILSTLTACAIALMDALWCEHHRGREQRWWRRAKQIHTFASLPVSAVFLYLAIVSRRYCWPSILAIWISAFMIGGDSVFFLFFYRKKITDRLSKLARSSTSSAIRRYRRLKDLALSPRWPSRVDEILPASRVSLAKPAAGASRFRDYPGTPPSPIPLLSRGQTGLSVPQPAVLRGHTLERPPDTRPILAGDEEDIALRLTESKVDIDLKDFPPPPIGTLLLMELRTRGIGATPIKEKYLRAGGEKVPGWTNLYPNEKYQRVDRKWHKVHVSDFVVAGPDDELINMVKFAVGFVVSYNETRESLDSVYDIASALSWSPATLVFSHQSEDENPELREEGRKFAMRLRWRFVEIYPTSLDESIEAIFVDLIRRCVKPTVIGLETESSSFF